jgi:hypothetical protein
VTFARRLIAGTILVLLVTVLVLVVAAERWLRRDLERDVRANLERQANLLREALPADTLEWVRFTERFGAAGAIRVTLIDRSGRVRADTDCAPADLPQVENHSNRPEGDRGARRWRGPGGAQERDGRQRSHVRGRAGRDPA